MTTDILLVEDDQDLREEVAAFLRYRGFGVRECGSVAEAAAKVRETPPRATILDVLLPDGSGLSLLPVLRSEFPQCVNLVLSARSEIALKLDAFAWGADGYLVKPVDLRELVAQLNAIFKRVTNEPLPGWIVQLGAPIISGPRGASLTVSLQEASLLRVMAASRDQFATRRELIEALGHDYLEYDEQRLEAMISRLRRKLAPLGDNPIKAEHGRGYVFTQPIRLA
jgi:two-component system OmpR family response regulator